MPLLRILFAQGMALVLLSTASTWADEPTGSRLILPKRATAVVGAPIGVWFDNLVLTEKPDRYTFRVHSELGTSDASHWMLTATEQDVGEHDWQIDVLEGDEKVASGQMTWNVIPASAAKSRSLRLLIVGDSLTHATIYPNDLARRFAEPEQPKVTFLGTHRPASAKEGVAHEGYGGWTWQRFLTHYEPNPDPAQRKFSSPFVFANDGKPGLDIPRYIREACGNEPPDVVIFLLGINDGFSADWKTPGAVDTRIDDIFGHADKLIAAFHEAAPKATLGVCLTTPANSRDASFVANYQDRYPRWGWKQIQHRLVERELEHFSGHEADGIFVIPTHLNLDPVDGYPPDNAVHPNAHGYHQIAATMHAWLLERLAASNKAK